MREYRIMTYADRLRDARLFMILSRSHFPAYGGPSFIMISLGRYLDNASLCTYDKLQQYVQEDL